MQSQNSSRLRIPSSGPSATTKRGARNFHSSDVDIAVDVKICGSLNLRTDDVFLMEQFEAELWQSDDRAYREGTDPAEFGCLPPRKERS